MAGQKITVFFYPACSKMIFRQGINIILSLFLWNYNRGKTCPENRDIGNKPCQSSVSIKKRMDADKGNMEFDIGIQGLPAVSRLQRPHDFVIQDKPFFHESGHIPGSGIFKNHLSAINNRDCGIWLFFPFSNRLVHVNYLLNLNSPV